MTNKFTKDEQKRPHLGSLFYFPVSLFATIMGLCGLTIAWEQSRWLIAGIVVPGLASFTSLCMMTLSLMYLIKLIRYPQAVANELKHPIRIHFFPAFSISLLLLSYVWKDLTSLSLSLWLLGSVVQFCLTLYVINSWINHSHYTLLHLNPSWFIPAVGNIIVPISGVALGFHEISWFFFSIGIVFWVILFTMVLYRLFFYDKLTSSAYPFLVILLAPPSIGFISYTNLIEGIDVFARVLFYIALFLSILLSTRLNVFLKLPFFLSSWAYSFPLASLTVATFKMSHLLQSTVLEVLGQVLLIFVTLVIACLVFNTFNAIRKNKICIPE